MINQNFFELIKSKLRAYSDVRNHEIFLFILCILIFAIFIFLTSEVQESIAGEKETIGLIDKYSLDFILQNRTPKLTSVAEVITGLGSGVVLGFLTLAIIAYEIFKKRWVSVSQILFVAIGSPILILFLKLFYERHRPDYALGLINETGYSYPSGHSLASAAIYFTISILISKNLTQKNHKFMVWVLFILLVLLIGFTRIYLGVHHASDVMAGILLGAVWAVGVECLTIYINRGKSHY